MATQNIYDDPDFFENYSRLPRSKDGLSAAPEWASLQALLPDLKGLRVVDLGCGYGWFCRFAREQGAEHVLGLDVSERMLARAEDMTSDPAIAYRRADLEMLDLVVLFCIQDVLPVGGQVGAEVYIIAVAPQAVAMIGINLNRSFFHFFENTCIGKDHESGFVFELLAVAK